MQYKILASDYDNTLVPFGEGKPRQKVVKAYLTNDLWLKNAAHANAMAGKLYQALKELPDSQSGLWHR